MNKNDFYMVLPSNSCPNIHPNNTTSNFKIEWPNSIILDDGEWEVALTEFSIFNQSIISIVNKSLKYQKTDMETRNYHIWVNENDSVVLHQLDSLSPIDTQVRIIDNLLTIKCPNTPFIVEFADIESAKRYGFRKVVNRSTNIHMMSPDIITGRNVGTSDQNKIILRSDTGRAHFNYIKFTEVANLTSLDELCKYIQKNANQVFESINVANNKLEFIFQPDIANVVFDQSLSNLLMLTQTHYGHSFSIHSDLIRVFEKTNYEIYVYSDLIEPIIVGDTYAPLLKTLWIEPKHVSDRVTHLSIDRPMYLPVSSNCINNVEFNLRHDSGKLISFLDNTKSCLTVHFRKRK